MFDIDKIRTLTPAERGYIAGFFDGEGHVALVGQSAGRKDRVVYAAIGQNRRAVLDWINSYFPGAMSYDKNSKCWKWRLASAYSVRFFLKFIRPYTIVKSAEIDEILRYFEEKDNLSEAEVDEIIERIKEHRKPTLAVVNE